jgi:hypothetical protein
LILPKGFFVTGAERDKFESLPGKRWGKNARVHRSGGDFFTIGDDGLCLACRHGNHAEMIRRLDVCHAVTVRTLDVSNVPPRELPDSKERPWELSATTDRVRARSRWTPAARSTPQEEARLSWEMNLLINQFISQLSPDRRSEFKTFSLDEIKMLRRMCDPDNDWGPQYTHGPTTPLFNTLTLEERIRQAQALRDDTEFAYLHHPKYFASERRGMPTRAEQQKRLVDEAFDRIIAGRKHRT